MNIEKLSHIRRFILSKKDVVLKMPLYIYENLIYENIRSTK